MCGGGRLAFLGGLDSAGAKPGQGVPRIFKRFNKSYFEERRFAAQALSSWFAPAEHAILHNPISARNTTGRGPVTGGLRNAPFALCHPVLSYSRVIPKAGISWLTGEVFERNAPHQNRF
jgi:hypothetical protein